MHVTGCSRLAWLGALLALAGCGAQPQAMRPVTVVEVPARAAVSTAELRRQQECLALAMYWEARGEGVHGMTAVGWTILNRMYSADFPRTACAVVYEGGERPGCQFSWYCDGRSDRPRDLDSWRRAMAVAQRLLTRPPPDPTGGALYFHSATIVSRWHRTRPKTAQIGGHVFYR